MPIRINLLAETLAEEELRRRDPVKRSIMAGILLVAVSLVWYSSIWLETLIENKSLSIIAGDMQSHTNEFAQIQLNLRKTMDYQRRIESLNKLSAARFLQGNLMEAMQKIYVPNVQITRFRLEQSYSVTAGSPPVTNGYGVVPGKPGTSVEHMFLSMDARDISANPGDQVNRFKDAVINQDYFKTILDRTNGVRLSNLGSPQVGSDGHAYVMFTLESKLPDKTR